MARGSHKLIENSGEYLVSSNILMRLLVKESINRIQRGKQLIKADIVVVGAGPGGAMAAQRLAQKGVQVALLEKNKVPWLKTCGDLVTREGLEALGRSGLGAWTEKFKLVDRIRFTAPNRQVLDIYLGKQRLHA